MVTCSLSADCYYYATCAILRNTIATDKCQADDNRKPLRGEAILIYGLEDIHCTLL